MIWCACKVLWWDSCLEWVYTELKGAWSALSCFYRLAEERPRTCERRGDTADAVQWCIDNNMITTWNKSRSFEFILCIWYLLLGYICIAIYCHKPAMPLYIRAVTLMYNLVRLVQPKRLVLNTLIKVGMDPTICSRMLPLSFHPSSQGIDWYGYWIASLASSSILLTASDWQLQRHPLCCRQS